MNIFYLLSQTFRAREINLCLLFFRFLFHSNSYELYQLHHHPTKYLYLQLLQNIFLPNERANLLLKNFLNLEQEYQLFDFFISFSESFEAFFILYLACSILELHWFDIYRFLFFYIRIKTFCYFSISKLFVFAVIWTNISKVTI